MASHKLIMQITGVAALEVASACSAARRSRSRHPPALNFALKSPCHPRKPPDSTFAERESANFRMCIFKSGQVPNMWQTLVDWRAVASV